MLEWPRFNLELNNYDPLNITISVIKDNKKQFSDFRKISIIGSANWFNRLNDPATNINMSK